MKSLLQDNDIEKYLTHNEGKLLENFLEPIKSKTYKYVTSISKNVYIDKLDDIVNKCNDRYHNTIKMKPVDVKPSPYTEEDPKFKIRDHIRISNYKNFYVPNWSEKVFLI